MIRITWENITEGTAEARALRTNVVGGPEQGTQLGIPLIVIHWGLSCASEVTEERRESSIFSQTLAFLLLLADCDKGFHGVGTH